MKNLKIFLVLLFIGGFESFAQTSLQILAKHQNKNISLRWSAMQAQDWEKGNKYGYSLLRETIKRNGKVLKKAENSIIKKILPASQTQWNQLAEKIDYAKIIKGYFYDDPIVSADTAEINNTLRGRFIFISLCADLSQEVAQYLALSYTDSSVKANEIYRYTVFLNNPDGLPSNSKATISSGLEQNIPSFPPQNALDLDYVDSTVTLQWDYPIISTFSAYHIERSVDGGENFQKISKTPYLPLENDVNSKIITFIDKVPKLHQTYIYRVVGLDPFGEESIPSNTVRIYAYQTVIPGGQNLRYSTPNSNNLILEWDYPDSLKINVKGFNVYRDYGLPHVKKMNQEPINLNSRVFVDKLNEADESIIYTIAAIDLRNKETQSEPLLVVLQDSIPPLKVDSLKAKMDKNGIVTLNWQKSKSIDVAGYDIYRAESDNPNEMYLVKQVEKDVYTAKDTVSLVASTRYVNYKVVASDFHVNYSRKNDTIRVLRPDIFPPKPPLFIAVYNTDSSIVLGWSPSNSEDVVLYRVWKSLPPDTTKTMLAQFDGSPIERLFNDKQWEEELLVKYWVEAIDAEGLSSGDSCKTDVQVPKPFRRPPVNLVFLKTLPKEKEDKPIVNIRWEYTCPKPISKFLISKKEKNESDFSRLTDVKGDIFEFNDLDVDKNKEYTYKIYAFCKDDTSSSSGKEVTLKIK